MVLNPDVVFPIHAVAVSDVQQMPAVDDPAAIEGGGGRDAAADEEEIPLVCRIHRVSEAFVSLIEKGGDTEEKALEELRRSAGIDFDPSVVAEFVNLEMFAPKISDERHESEQSSAEVSE